MQTHKKLKARVLSLVLSALMVVTTIPMNVLAAREGDLLPDEDSGIIVSFDQLEDRFSPSTGKDAPDHVYSLTVELDTAEEALQLPDELTATVKRTYTTSTPSDAGEEIIPDEDEMESGNQPASPSDAEEEVNEEIKDEDVPLALEPEQDEETIVTTVESESIPVEWNSDKAYKSDENGKFIYTAVLPEGYILADSVELPQIYVFVGKQMRAAGTAHDISTGPLALNSGDGCSVSAPHVVTGITTSNTITATSSEHWVTLDGVNISVSVAPAFNIQDGTVHLSLAAGTTNTLTGTGMMCGALVVSNSASLDISGTGTLIVNGGMGMPGIGNMIYAPGNITINGGAIIANGGSSAAGIGGGMMTPGGNITIKGGTVVATGVSSGIGGGAGESGGNITINGGTVTAIGEIGIGGADDTEKANIKISNAAKVTAVAAKENYKAIWDTDGTIAPDSGTVANMMVFDFASEMASGTAIEIKDSNGQSLSPAVSYTPTANFNSIAFSVPSTGNYKAYAGTTKMTVPAGDTFAVAAGLNTYSDITADIPPSIIVGGSDTNYPATAEGLQKAFTDIPDDGTVKIGANIDLGTTGVTISGTNSVTLDLNDKEITCAITNSDSSGSDGAIKLSDSASLTVTDDSSEKAGQLAATGNRGASIVNVGTGTVTVTNGTVTATGQSSKAINNKGTGTVTVQGGTLSVYAQAAKAIHNEGGTVTIAGGTLSARGRNPVAIANATAGGTVTVSAGEVSAGGGLAIQNASTGTISVSGGIVSSNVSTIENWDIGKITISGSAVVTSSTETQGRATIYLMAVPTEAPFTVLDVQGGTISNTASPEGYSVYFEPASVTFANLSDYYTQASGATVGRVYPEAPEIIVGGSSATNGYETANAVNLQKAFKDIPDGGTVKLGEDIDFGTTNGVMIPAGKQRITLDLDTHLITHGGIIGAAITVSQGASLTVQGTTGGIVSSSSTTINNTMGTLTIQGGTFKSTGKRDAISSNGTLMVSGGKVEATNPSPAAIYSFGNGKVTISETATVTSQSTKGTIIFKYLAQDAPKPVLEIKDTASVTNTASPSPCYAVYFDESKVTVDNLSEYYTKDSTATVGKVYPEAAAVAEQFTLALGETYYFDLSGEAGTITSGISDKLGTINTALPDATLHYVPFTYAGTVNAYSLDSSSSGDTGASAAATASDRSLFVADYVVGHTISWDSLNTNNLIFGNTFDINYKLRSMSGGSSEASSQGSPTANEWDKILDKDTNYIQNASGTWVQDTESTDASIRAVRGIPSARSWNSISSSYAHAVYSFRPALEVLNPVTLTSDGLKAVELDWNGGKFNNSTDSIQIVCAGDNFKTPGNQGLTRPDGNTGASFSWNTAADGTGTKYAIGASVPNTVTKLYAQWETAKTLSGIAVTTPPNRTIYNAGESFDKTGMVVTATYSDASTAAVTSYTITPGGALAASDTKVTVSYTEDDVTKTADISITVNGSSIDKSELQNAITAANNAKRIVIVSDNDASSVSNGTKFVTTAEMKALTDAIAAAKAVADDADATEAEVTAAVTALNNAVNTFKATIKTGTKSGGGSSSSSQTIWTSVPPAYTGGTKIIGNVRVPDYTVEGNWKNTNGAWTFTGNDGQAYKNSWAPVFNPYANVPKGQSAFDWFLFDANGTMMTGWYTDAEGSTYYLNPNSDNTLGAMQTGWVLIDGKYYYFNEKPDGTRGKLFQNTRTPDGYLVDKNGVWDGSDKQ